MKIEVTCTQNGCEEGSHDTKEYKKGTAYDMGDALAEVFLKNSWGIKAKAKKKKAVKDAPEDKNTKGADEDKGEKKDDKKKK